MTTKGDSPQNVRIFERKVVPKPTPTHRVWRRQWTAVAFYVLGWLVTLAALIYYMVAAANVP